jgi:hypothetical protein
MAYLIGILDESRSSGGRTGGAERGGTSGQKHCLTLTKHSVPITYLIKFIGAVLNT